jgi:hypothetical protein
MSFSLATRMACMGARRNQMDASGGGAAHVYALPMPAKPEDAPSSSPLAIVALALPCGVISASAGLALLTLTPVVGFAAGSGVAGWVRFVDGSGVAVYDALAGLPGSNAPVILTDGKPEPSMQFFAGGEVQIAAGQWAD